MKTQSILFNFLISGTLLLLSFISTKSQAEFIVPIQHVVSSIEVSIPTVGNNISSNLRASHKILEQRTFSVTQHKEKVEVINTSEDPKLVDYILYSQDGGTVSEGSFKKDLQIYIGELKAGLYILDINNGGIIETHKVIILE